MLLTSQGVLCFSVGHSRADLTQTLRSNNVVQAAHKPTQIIHHPTTFGCIAGFLMTSPNHPSPTTSSHTSPFFHAQYLERSEHYAHSAPFSISWLFLFGLLALGLGIAYWSLAAWETYFVNDPYYRELRDLTAIANAITALVITLPPHRSQTVQSSATSKPTTQRK